MVKRIAFLTAMTMLFICFFNGCALFDKGDGKDIYYPVYSDTDSFDPQIADDEVSDIVATNCFEGLVKYDEDGKIQPGVALDWDISNDGTTYTFHLDSNAKWYVGKDALEVLNESLTGNFNDRVTADDFVFGLKRYFDPETQAEPDSRLYAIENAAQVASGKKSLSELGVYAQDSSTLVIKLSTPSDSFLGALTKGSAMPCREEFFLATKGRYGLSTEYIICNGPFYLSYRAEGSYIEMLKNENYSKADSVSPSGIYLYVNADEKTRVSKLEEATYDVCPLSMAQRNIVDNDDITYKAYGNSVWALCFNCSDSVLSNSDMRIAICKSTDVTAIKLPETSLSYADGFIPPVCRVGESEYRSNFGAGDITVFDENSAREHFKAGKSKLGVDNVSLNLICPKDYETHMRKLVQLWQKSLGVNFRITIESLTLDELEERVENKDYDIAFARLSTKYGMASSFLEEFTEREEYKVFSYQSLSFGEKVNEASSAVNSGEIGEKCKEAENILLNNGVVYPVFYEESYLGFAENVSGMYMIEAGTIPVFAGGKRID